MRNPGDSTSDEEQSETVLMNYRTLLAITRPLVITSQTSLSLGAPILENEVVSSGVKDRCVEFALRKGEIICSDRPIRNRQGEEGLAATPALPQRGSDLRLRIHLGMS